ncbi:phage antirepressor KilAC domain-containing protein [Lelliottia wanjuensis]|uniref:phage antirepressor KilAC domain-containing protein n=1 Tax=Lelliottia wanjuensis TaxID=3050585 RepID=UPI002550508E|nr:phage antirepressor KilAC domain-containing protein [Lelliottia sp. V104_15]MDK9607098.1 phage antirepressor KilAC domain-containing protein [Lelliottia sp. V104_15]
MNNLVSSSAPTMSSREIAELVKSNHSDVKRSAERLHAAQLLTQPLAEFDFEHNGNTYHEYRFNKRDSLVLVARLSPEFTAAVVDRWQELEEKNSKPALPGDYLSALKALTAEVEQRQLLENKLAVAEPKVQFVDSYVLARGALGFRETCKLLKVKESELRALLVDQKVMYYLAGKLTPYANHIDAGRFTVKTGEADNGHAFTQVKFTPKGIQWIAGLLMAKQLEVA